MCESGLAQDVLVPRSTWMCESGLARSYRRENRILRMGEDPKMAECPVCGGAVELTADAVVGELLECPDCGSELEVLGLEPAALGEAPETEEDWGE